MEGSISLHLYSRSPRKRILYVNEIVSGGSKAKMVRLDRVLNQEKNGGGGMEERVEKGETWERIRNRYCNTRRYPQSPYVADFGAMETRISRGKAPRRGW